MQVIGTKIQDFLIQELLGHGGFAQVYRARCQISGMEVAIKMIEKSKMRSQGMTSRVTKEVAIHSRVQHPSVLKLYTYFEDSTYVYLVLEMCHNGEFYSFLKDQNRALTENEARHYMQDIVDGLLYLHSHGILHRDLTLANLLLTKDMDLKIADFGLATQLANPQERQFTVCGTPNYISPEVAMHGSHGLEADVWSVGCMLYTMLVGRPPFHDKCTKTTLDNVITAEYVLPEHLTEDAKDLIKSLLQKDPRQRIRLQDVSRHPFFTRMVSSPGGSSASSIQDELSPQRTKHSTANLSQAVRQPLCAARLKPIRQKTKNAVLNILDNGSVCLEFFKMRSGEERVYDVITISADGLSIEVLHPHHGRGMPLTDTITVRTPEDVIRSYSFQELPSSYWKKYDYATRFVNMVRSKTPKVTLLLPKAKCILMENSPNADVEIIFYGGGKIHKSQDTLRVTEPNGRTASFATSQSTSELPSSVAHLVEYANQCHVQVLNLERTMVDVEDRSSRTLDDHVSCFPNIVDRRLSTPRKTNNTKIAKSSICKTPSSPPSYSSPPKSRDQSMSCGSSTRSSRTSACTISTISSGRSAVKPPTVICKIFVPKVGWGVQMSCGKILIQFTDGSQLSVQPYPMVVSFTDVDGKCSKYGTSDTIPLMVHKRLEYLPIITSRLEAKHITATA